MRERLGLSSIPVQKMPDFHAALAKYRGILQSVNVSPTDITNAENRILEQNKTRRAGNTFINLVNGLSREGRFHK